MLLTSNFKTESVNQPPKALINLEGVNLVKTKVDNSLTSKRQTANDLLATFQNNSHIKLLYPKKISKL